MNRMKSSVCCVLFCLLSLQLSAQQLEIQLPNKSLSWTLAQIKQQVPVQHIKLFDPVYQSEKSFDGVSLLQLLKAAGYQQGQAADEVVLTAADGYAPSMPLEFLLDDQAVLVFAESGKPDFDFAPVAQGKAMLSPAPFYLVWKQGKAVGKTRPWPYQLVKLELVSFAQKYPLLYPTKASQLSAAYQGFLLFKQNCISCHSINLQGGAVGPELNAPKNVSEYWSEPHLKAFIQKASSYRYKSKMPDFSKLSDQDVEQLIAYLKHMKDYKIQQPH